MTLCYAIALLLLSFVCLFPSLSYGGSAAEEASKAAGLMYAAVLNSEYAIGNETDVAAYATFVDNEFAAGHSELDDCTGKVHDQKDIAVEWASKARTNLPIVQAENANAQAAVAVDDEGTAKHAREETEDAAKICADAAKKTAEALSKAKEEYQNVNKAAKEADDATEIYGETKTLYDIAVHEKEELDKLSDLADVEASPEKDGSIGVAMKVREQKAIADTKMPEARSAMEVLETENDRAQIASAQWDESGAKYSREEVRDAAHFVNDNMKKVRDAYKKAKGYFFSLKLKEAKEREKEMDEKLKLRRELKETLDKLIATAIDDAESQSVIQSFAEVMKNLLQSIDSRLKIKVKKDRRHNRTESGNGIDGTTGITAGESLAELMQTIFRPLPSKKDGSILNETTGTCVTTLQAFRNVYFNQIEILQRGLPTPLLQNQFSKPFALVSTVDDNTCIPYEIVKDYFTADWHLKDTLLYGGLLEMDTLENLNGKEFPFLSFISVPSNTLPAIGGRDITKIRDLWDRTVATKQSLSGATSSPKDVYFPRTVDYLYDNDTNAACIEYHKFGRHNGRDTLNAREAAILVFATALRLLGMGGSKPSVAQMIANLAAFIFNGVRCTRKEGKHVRIPAALLKAYSINTARIIGEIPSLGSDPLISMDTVEQVYATEIHAMTSFDTWGNYYFHAVYPDGHYDNIAFVEAFFDNGRYNTVLALSSNARMLTVKTSRQLLTNSTEKQGTCGQQFKYEGQVVIQTNLMESCCAGTCNLLSTMDDCLDLYLVCCQRCNEHSCVSSTVDEMAELPAFSIIVPEYGERESYAVPLMI